MPTVFLSYRRSDSAGEAGRLGDALRQALGEDFAFRDVTHITPGEHFDGAIDAQLTAAQVVVVLIGAEWLTELTHRLARPEVDYHRLEIAQALEQGKRVIPLLLNGTPLPAPDALPPDLHALTRCHAFTMRDETWPSDVERLVATLGRPYSWGRLGLRVAAVLPAAVLLVWLGAKVLAPDAEAAQLRLPLGGLLAAYGLVEALLGWRHAQQLKRLR
jgi:hypothetical protein